MQACKNLKNGKSCGMDGILNEMIKYGQHALLPCLEKLFNIILSSGSLLSILFSFKNITSLLLRILLQQFTPTTINSYTPIIIWI
jgi:hypothetical protein